MVLRVLTSEHSKFSSYDKTPWMATTEEALSPAGERVPVGTLVKCFQTQNFGWVLIHPSAILKRRLFKE